MFATKGLQIGSSQHPTLKWPVNMHQIISTAAMHNFTGFQKKSLGPLLMAEMCNIRWWCLLCQSAAIQETKGHKVFIMHSCKAADLMHRSACWRWSGPSQQCKLHHAANAAFFVLVKKHTSTDQHRDYWFLMLGQPHGSCQGDGAGRNLIHIKGNQPHLKSVC